MKQFKKYIYLDDKSYFDEEIFNINQSEFN